MSIYRLCFTDLSRFFSKKEPLGSRGWPSRVRRRRWIWGPNFSASVVVVTSPAWETWKSWERVLRWKTWPFFFPQATYYRLFLRLRCSPMLPRPASPKRLHCCYFLRFEDRWSRWGWAYRLRLYRRRKNSCAASRSGSGTWGGRCFWLECWWATACYRICSRWSSSNR